MWTDHERGEEVEQVEGQGGDEVEEEPGAEIVDRDLPDVGDNLTLFIHKCCPEVEKYV